MADPIGPLERKLHTELRIKARLPILAPAESRVKTPDLPPQPAICLSSASAHEESTDFRDREESHDACARLTVYAINACIMLFMFPVGFALLIFNILGGENLRTTSHVMALTGLAVALGMPGMGLAAVLI